MSDPLTQDHLLIHPDVRIPVDGEVAAATRFQPVDTDGPLPVVLMAYPYHKDDFITYGGHYSTITYLVANDYEVVVADMIGTGASSGTSPKPFSSTEGQELVAMIEWLAERDWSTGRIGMFGQSYGGLTCFEAAAERPDSLEAIVPLMISDALYEDRMYQDGAPSYGALGHWAPLMQALRAKPSTFRDPDDRWASVWKERLDGLDDATPWLFQYLDHDTKDEFWTGMEIPRAAFATIDVPTFQVSGWRDSFPAAHLEYHDLIDAPKRLLLGPWRHVLPHVGRETDVDFRRQVVEWFDQFLKGEDTGATDRPSVSYWTERDGGGRVDEGVWRGTDAFPTLGASNALSYSLSTDGLVRRDSHDDGLETRYEFDHSVGMESIDRIARGLHRPTDTGADDARSLCFETDPLSRPVELTGAGEATIRIESTTEDPLLVVRVVDVGPDGEARMVTHGQHRLSHLESHSDPEPLTPGEEYRVTLPLKPKSHVFEADHRIRVAISAAYFPFMLPTGDHGSFAIRSTPDEPSGIRFPGTEHGGDVTFADRIEMDHADDAIPVESPFPFGGDGSWEVARDHFADVASFRTAYEFGLDLPHDATLLWDEATEARIDPGDPSTWSVSRETTVELDHGTEQVRIETTSRVSRTTARAATRVLVDDGVVFDRTWRR